MLPLDCVRRCVLCTGCAHLQNERHTHHVQANVTASKHYILNDQVLSQCTKQCQKQQYGSLGTVQKEKVSIGLDSYL